MTALFIAVLSSYFISQIHHNFRQQSDRLLKQSVAVTQERIATYREQLNSELESLSESLFTENENILAAMLSRPPNYNAEVIGFAEKLRRRSTLDFLCIVSATGDFLSNSMEPERFGKTDPFRDLPLNEVVFVQEQQPAMELKIQRKFGRHMLHLRGGYFLKDKLRQPSISGLQIDYELNGTPGDEKNPDPAFLRQRIPFNDYLGKRIATVTVSVSQKELIQQREQMIRNSLYLLAASLVFCFLIGWLISYTISKPLNRLTEAAQEMSSGNLNVRVQNTGSGEIGKLMHAFNTMSEQLEENRLRLIQTERIAAWNEIAKHLAHEIKNPLTPIRTSITNLQLAMERAPDRFPEILKEASESIIEEVEALRRLADEFARFARLPAPQKELHQLNDIVQKAFSLYRNGIPSNIHIHFHPSQMPAFLFDAPQMTQVIHNLLQNSVEANDAGGEIHIETSIAEHSDKKWAQLTVRDNGPGMTEQIKQQVFTPYFTTKRKGTGLGLAIVHRIVTEHGGNILVESEPDKGTTFEVRLPLATNTVRNDDIPQ